MSTGIDLALIPGMSRVERRENDEKWDATDRRRQPVDRTPSKAEGDEATVDEALRNDEKREEPE